MEEILKNDDFDKCNITYILNSSKERENIEKINNANILKYTLQNNIISTENGDVTDLKELVK